MKSLLAALDEWELAEDRANEAAAALSGPAPLAKEQIEEIGRLQREAAQKLAALRLLVADDFVPSRF